MKDSKTAWIFDVDGVITNPQEKKITEPKILEEIIKRLKLKEPVALNTGRSLSWMIEKVINPLIGIVSDKTILTNFFAVGEKGGTWLEFNNQGKFKEYKDDNISIPDNVKDLIRNLIKDKYADSMFYDESKLTMISTEMNYGHNLENYKRRQEEISDEFKKLLIDQKLNEKFKIDPTTIATDIENKFVGKHFAVKRIIDWIKNKGFEVQKYVAFGDSFRSDIPMAEEINSQGLPVEFIYVGNENVESSEYSFPIRQTKAKFGAGTLEFLKSNFG